MQSRIELKNLAWARLNLSEHIEDGYSYALWVGAGLTIQLGRIGSSKKNIYDWPTLVNFLEKEISIQANKSSSYKERLQKCWDQLGEIRFQEMLREQILNNLWNIIDSSSDKDVALRNELLEYMEQGKQGPAVKRMLGKIRRWTGW